MPRFVLGTGLSHDGSACLLRDGEIAVAVEKERITRKKHDGFNDTAAATYCLRAEGIEMRDVELVVQNANFAMFEYGNDWFQGPRNVDRAQRVVSLSHHLAHAYSAFLLSPFSETAVLVIDGCGNAFDHCMDLPADCEEPPAELRHLYFEKDSFYVGCGRELHSVRKEFSPWGFGQRAYPMHPRTTRDSIGGIYSAVSEYVFGGLDDPGKLMGLAPYGRSGVFKDSIFDLCGGSVSVRYDWMRHFRAPARTMEMFLKNFQYYADIAFWVQREIERAVLYVIQTRRASAAHLDSLCYAGGVALNAVANRRVLSECGYNNVFIPPAAGDNGLAIGCAFYGWTQILKQTADWRTEATCLGRAYSEEDYAEACRAIYDQCVVSRPADVSTSAAEMIARGKVLGWFQGRSEFGPRALGNRSIIADPREESIRHHINRVVKLREDFRPFAPACLEEDTATYFEQADRSPYMLLVATVRPEWRSRLRAVVHVDGSARLQTVAKDTQPFYALIAAFKERTGLGVILNTSLNRRGMPIVETPKEAVEFFVTSGLDGMVLGRFLVTKRSEQRLTSAPVYP